MHLIVQGKSGLKISDQKQKNGSILDIWTVRGLGSIL
jgi:hypothetical protein